MDDELVPTYEPSLLHLIKEAELAVKSHMDSRLRKSPVTVLQQRMLATLDYRPGITAGELARRSFVSPQAMTGILNDLEDRGYITRGSDHDNRSRRPLYLTPQGSELNARLYEVAKEVEDLATSRLDVGQVEQFRSALNAVLDSLGKAEKRIS